MSLFFRNMLGTNAGEKTSFFYNFFEWNFVVINSVIRVCPDVRGREKLKEFVVYESLMRCIGVVVGTFKKNVSGGRKEKRF